MQVQLQKSVPSPALRSWLTVWLSGLALLAAGCGQKGPLTLPQVPATGAAAASAASAATR